MSGSSVSSCAFTVERCHVAIIRAASAVGVACLATVTQAETELWFRRAEKIALARGIQRDGFACAELRTVYFVETRPDGNHMRAVCGTSDGSAAPSTFRRRFAAAAPSGRRGGTAATAPARPSGSPKDTG